MCKEVLWLSVLETESLRLSSSLSSASGEDPVAASHQDRQPWHGGRGMCRRQQPQAGPGIQRAERCHSHSCTSTHSGELGSQKNDFKTLWEEHPLWPDGSQPHHTEAKLATQETTSNHSNPHRAQRWNLWLYRRTEPKKKEKKKKKDQAKTKKLSNEI